MRSLRFTTGSPFARAVRIILDELALTYEKREEITTPTAAQRAEATPTLQVPTLWDGVTTLWESGTIAEYLLSTYTRRPAAEPALAKHAWRPKSEWQDKLVFSTVQTFGSAATMISQITWTGVGVDQNAHLHRSAEKLTQILGWLEEQLQDVENGFIPGCVSIHDIFIASHIRFVQARPLGVDLDTGDYEKIDSLLSRMDQRTSFRSNPVWWWEPGVISYEPDGTPIYQIKN